MSIHSVALRRDRKFRQLLLSSIIVYLACRSSSYSSTNNGNLPVIVRVLAWNLNAAANCYERIKLQSSKRKVSFVHGKSAPSYMRRNHVNDDEHVKATSSSPMPQESIGHSINRRSVMKQTIDQAISISTAAITMDSVIRWNPSLAYASSTTTTTATATTDITPEIVGQSKLQKTPATIVKANSAVLCDSTISVWSWGGRDEGSTDSCTIYLLGTAHISDVSASLAGTLVRQVHPDAVFVELDVKRVQNLPAMPTIAALPSTSSSSSTPILNADTASTSKPAILVPMVSPSSSLDSSLSSSMESPTTSSNAGSTGGNRNWFQRRLLNLAGAAVGKGISSMYSNLSSSGFQPGEEFAEAIRTGREIDATIVLGDQDVQVTLRRLAEALSMTDLNQLLNPDSQLEQTMSNLLPALPPSIEGSSDKGTNDPTQFKRELSDYVEQMKSRETVRTIIQELNTLAPEVVRVMLTERDTYMAKGLHTLRQSYPKVVAVMGLAHIDGVERNLQSFGWKPVQLSCPK